MADNNFDNREQGSYKFSFKSIFEAIIDKISIKSDIDLGMRDEIDLTDMGIIQKKPEASEKINNKPKKGLWERFTDSIISLFVPKHDRTGIADALGVNDTPYDKQISAKSDEHTPSIDERKTGILAKLASLVGIKLNFENEQNFEKSNVVDTISNSETKKDLTYKDYQEMFKDQLPKETIERQNAFGFFLLTAKEKLSLSKNINQKIYDYESEHLSEKKNELNNLSLSRKQYAEALSELKNEHAKSHPEYQNLLNQKEIIKNFVTDALEITGPTTTNSSSKYDIPDVPEQTNNKIMVRE